MTKIAIVGTGRMGQELASLAPESGCEVVAQLGRGEVLAGITEASLQGAAVVIEFTVPSAAPSIIRTCATLGVPVVSGTTGWDAERDAIERAVRDSKGALLWAPNFSIGVHLFSQVVAEAAKRFTKTAGGFAARIVETHHEKKLDAPSGTAKRLSGIVEQVRGEAPPIASIRTGLVPGTHELIFDAPFEEVRLVHEAHDRRIFAAGALAAARWIAGKRGVYAFDDFIGELAR